MNRSIIGRLIVKDWRLNRLLVSLTAAAGVVALALAQYGGQTARLLGGVWFFVALCVLGSMLPTTAILNEQKKQTLPFIMSLPVSPVQYTLAKIVAVWALFLTPWLALLISAVILVETGHTASPGVIPTLLILAVLPLIGFCVMSSTALIGESEGWLVAATVAINSSYWLGWYLLTRVPSIAGNWSNPAPVWNPAAVLVLSAELGVIGLIVGVTLVVQSRKREFI